MSTRRLFLYDSSPGLGGALTSARDLAAVLRRRGWSTTLAHVAPVPQSIIDAFDEVMTVGSPSSTDRTGPRFLHRERTRRAHLAVALARSRPDVVLLNNAPAANLAGALAASAAHLPVAQYIRADLHRGLANRRALRLVDATFAVGLDAHLSARALGASARLVGEGLDCRRWPSARSDEHGLLFAAADQAWKGRRMVEEAVSLLRGAPALQVCVASNASRTAHAPRPGLRAVLHRDPASLDAVRRRCHIYIHGAQRPEPFGRATLEAMAAGLCPVVPDVGGANLVTDGLNGRTYRLGDANDLRRVLQELVDDTPTTVGLGRRAAMMARCRTAAAAFEPVTETLEHLVGSRPAMHRRLKEAS